MKVKKITLSVLVYKILGFAISSSILSILLFGRLSLLKLSDFDI